MNRPTCEGVPVGKDAPVGLRLVLDVSYEPNGVSARELSRMLEDLVAYGLGNGLLTGPTPAEVERHRYTVCAIDANHAGCLPAGSQGRAAMNEPSAATHETPRAATGRGRRGLWKTTVAIWSETDPQTMELSELALEAESGGAFCSSMHAEYRCDPSADADLDAEDMEFFFGPAED